MTTAIALIDGNNFYASCEQMIDPSLVGNPLVILSNNDGCIISRNSEARKLGIPMGVPYFKVRPQLEILGVNVRSSNYSLYGDISSRLMALIKSNCEEFEIYSIDEAFVKLTRPVEPNLYSWARELRSLAYRNLGIPIAIGIGKTKVQAKIANYLAKSITTNPGIFDLNSTTNIDKWLELVDIENVWGIGRQLTYWYRIHGIKNARQFRDMPSNLVKVKHGVVGIRLQNELKGQSCIKFTVIPSSKKETCVSRSFSRAVTNKEDLRQSIAKHVVRASEKLRKQKQRAGTISIFTRTSSYLSMSYNQVATKKLNIPSNNTGILLTEALALTEQIYRPHVPLIKAGVLMQELQKMDYLQQNLFESANLKKELKQIHLMALIDNLNKRYGRDTITWASCGTHNVWEMRQEKLSSASTTRYEEIPIVNV
tara:strand:+ start:590 stop:1864 length:1275 start_codon:yes stop_codon:yes gene_type:complete